MLTKKSQKSLEIFLCEICDYRTSKIYDYNKHLSTRKHKMLTNVDKKSQKVAENFEPINGVNIFECVCGKKFAYRQSLSVRLFIALNTVPNDPSLIFSIKLYLFAIIINIINSFKILIYLYYVSNIIFSSIFGISFLTNIPYYFL